MELSRIEVTQQSVQGDRQLTLIADLKPGDNLADSVAELQDCCWALLELGGIPQGIQTAAIANAAAMVGAIRYQATSAGTGIALTAEMEPGESPGDCLATLKSKVHAALGVAIPA
jgi:hypothetical protein